jgi:tetratricopeptide repeat protein
MECPRCFYITGDAVDEARCRKCGRSYRPSVNVYLGLVALVYIVFVRYFNTVLTGVPLGDMQTRPPQTVLDPFLYRWAHWPIDIQMRPALILVLGAMLAVLVFVPILMSVLYGKRGGFFLAAIAVILGPSLGIGVLLFLSAWIAGGWTLRLPSKVGSVLLACAPMWAFLLLCSRAPGNVPLPTAYYVPALIAVALCLSLTAILLLLMRLVTYNVRWAGIVLCVLCVLPIASYKLWVGEDGIDYAVLRRDYGMQSGQFVDMPGRKVQEKLKADLRKLDKEEKEKAAEKAAADVLAGKRVFRPDLIPPDKDAQRGRSEARLNNLKIQLAADLQTYMGLRQRETLEACADFMKRFPDSPHKSDVLYTMIWAGDMDIDTRALRREDPGGMPIRYDWSRIRNADEKLPVDTRGLCKRMIAECGDTGYAIEAMVKLADDAAYHGDVAGAMARYDAVIKQYGSQMDAKLEDMVNLSVFSDLLRVGDLRRARHRQSFIDKWYRVAKGNRAFLVENSDCRRCKGVQLKAYLDIAMFQIDDVRRKNLNRILDACPECKLVDNVACDLARMEGNITKRIAALKHVADAYPGTDGAAEAIRSLIEMEWQLANRSREKEGQEGPAFSLDVINKKDPDGEQQVNAQRAAAYYRRLRKEYPESYKITGWATLFYSCRLSQTPAAASLP